MLLVGSAIRLYIGQVNLFWIKGAYSADALQNAVFSWTQHRYLIIHVMSDLFSTFCVTKLSESFTNKIADNKRKILLLYFYPICLVLMKMINVFKAIIIPHTNIDALMNLSLQVEDSTQQKKI